MATRWPRENGPRGWRASRRWQPAGAPTLQRADGALLSGWIGGLPKRRWSAAGWCPLAAEADARASHLRRGWYWGSQEFAERMLKLGEAVLKKTRHRTFRASQESRAHGEQEARRLIIEGLAAAGLTEEELAHLPGSEARKVAIARLVWEQTTMDLKWIAERLALRSPANASQQIRRHRAAVPPLPSALKRWARPVKIMPDTFSFLQITARES